jgi:hypothetical protein
MNILGESKVLLSFMKPNSSESINVFDMIWQEIIHAACFPLKGCLHAPFIMKMIEVVTQFRFDKGTRHLSYTPFWIDPNNPAGRLRKAPSSSRGPTAAGPSRPSPGRGSPTPRCRGRGRGRGRGMGARLAHGIAAFFSMCRNISSDVHELARRQRETDDNLHRQASSMGMPFPPRSPDVPLHPPPPEINEWHQQAYGVPFMSAEDEEEDEEYFDDREQFVPPPPRGIWVNPLHILLPRILQEAILLQLSLGKKTLRRTWQLNSLIRILLSGDLWLVVLSFFGASCQKGEKDSHLGSTFNLCNEHLVYNNFIRLIIVMHVVMA